VVHSAFCSELLCTIIQSCHEDYRSKFTQTLNGMTRLLDLVKGCIDVKLESEEQLSTFQNQFEAISGLLLGS
jgi:hypothetical protein